MLYQHTMSGVGGISKKKRKEKTWTWMDQSDIEIYNNVIVENKNWNYFSKYGA